MRSFTRREYLAGAGICAGAGAAAGTILSGLILGTQTTEVDQAVVIQNVETYAYEDGMGIVSSDGTEFELGATIYQGDMWATHFLVHNRSDEEQAQRLTLGGIPDGLTVEAFSDPPTGVHVRRVDMREWLVTVEPAHEASVPDDEQVLEFLVAARNDIDPGFKQIQGVLAPMSFDEVRA